MGFDKLYKENFEAVRKVCFSYLKNQEDADDATQDTFFKASQSLDSFNDDSAVSTWLIRIAKNVCSDKLSARKKEQKMYTSTSDGQELWSDSYQDVATPEAILEAEQNAGAMSDAFTQLNDKTREVMSLRFVDELTYKEIAEKLDVPVGTVRTWLHRGRVHLLNTISPQ